MKRFIGILLITISLTGCGIINKKTYHCLVPSDSMNKTLVYGEKIAYSKNSDYKNNVNYADVLIYKDDEAGIRCISRCIAKENDYIEIKDNIVYVNDKKLDEDYCFYDETMTPRNKEYDSFILNIPKTQVPANCIFVLCDNRWNSLDSRYKGAIPCDKIIGKVLYVVDDKMPDKKRYITAK